MLARVVKHSQVEPLEQWVQHHWPRLSFGTVLAEIDQKILDKQWDMPIDDTFTMQSSAAQELLMRLHRFTTGLYEANS